MHEGQVGKDRNTDFAVDFLDVHLTLLVLRGVEAVDVARTLGVIDDNFTAVRAGFRTDRNAQRTSRQVDQVAGDVTGDTGLIEEPGFLGVDSRERNHGVGHRVRAEDVDRNTLVIHLE